ncbi:zinc-binding alcohol dehydrogenase family protein [Prosthecomicrobium pneumaticum]|uniref:Zinc-type alcohol dehydrogenase-like protein n=1 Tax=Prosthecomicrobium pneumaticum TaxID=81895 RepID=A0A7W9FLR5_9HYPH|nr:zinc-binding alcohol dehydrogenase family protein [Prosthecomicrobium pneumaticum]MBB5753003.1 zinc-binding alcohol dehydrogenase family protein [Prosthecomicrobium pneumaticum]
MRAVAYRQSLPITEEAALLDVVLDRPEPGPRDLLVRVAAVSVNPVDTKVRKRADPKGEPKVLGYDAAGTVEAVGAEVTLFRPGDAVFYAGSIARPGTNSEFHCVDERIVGRKPATLSFAEAAAIPLTAITAYELLFDRIGVEKGETGRSLLVIGGAGGVGSVAIQLARALTGLTVVASASRPETAEWVRALGAHHVVDHTKPLDEEAARIGLPQIDIVLALTQTATHWPAIQKLVAPQGHVGIIDDMETLDIVPFKAKAIGIHWESMFTRPVFGTPDMIRQHELLDEVAGLVDAGRLRTTIQKTLSPIDAANLKAAHALIESGRSIGKIVVEGW